jgi:hypothetical protein
MADPPAPVTRPSTGWFLLLDGGLALLALLALGRGPYRVARRRVPLPPRAALQALLGATAVVHVAEAAAAARQAKARGLPVRPWALQTLVVGFPSLLALRRTPAAT